MHDIGMFNRRDALSLKGFEGSGADWLERYKPYLNDGKTTVNGKVVFSVADKANCVRCHKKKK